LLLLLLFCLFREGMAQGMQCRALLREEQGQSKKQR
jgi:hypothetical protein